MTTTIPREKHITGIVLSSTGGTRLLQECLDSLDFCHRIIVVDSYSKDETLAIAKASKAEVYERAWEGGGPQFQFAFDKISHGWVVILDQDEICSDALKTSILNAVNTDDGKAGYYISRCSWYFDRFMKHSGWYPDRLLRLFRIEKMDMRISGAHWSFHPKGKAGFITKGTIIHYPFTGFANHWAKMDSYAQQGADHMRAKGKKPSLLKAILHAHWKFFRIYFLKQGFRDGKAGFINATFGAFYTFSRYVRVFDASWGAPYTDRPAFLDEETKKS